MISEFRVAFSHLSLPSMILLGRKTHFRRADGRIRMVALRSIAETAGSAGDEPLPPPRPEPADWLSLQQAACELNLSISTVRRMIRRGQLRNRIVPRRGGFRYLIYLPNSRHAKMESCRHAEDGALAPPRLVQQRPHLRLVRDRAPTFAAEDEPEEIPVDEVRRLEIRAERLSRSLSRALIANRTSAPDDLPCTEIDPDDPYGRYRWLARRRRKWWQLS
jgi:hypothetical protein